MDEVKEQVKDGISRINQLVSIDNKPFANSSIGCSCTISDIRQAEGLRCDLVVWATTDGIN
jgi:hypothetical protein